MEAQYLPIIVEVTKFALGELGKWLDHARQRIGKDTTKQSLTTSNNKNMTPLTLQEFTKMTADLQSIQSTIDVGLARTNAYIIDGLKKQIQIHYRNLSDLEQVEAAYGMLTPISIKRDIELQSEAIVEKTERLEEMLSKIYGRDLEISTPI